MRRQPIHPLPRQAYIPRPREIILAADLDQFELDPFNPLDLPRLVADAAADDMGARPMLAHWGLA